MQTALKTSSNPKSLSWPPHPCLSYGFRRSKSLSRHVPVYRQSGRCSQPKDPFFDQRMKSNLIVYRSLRDRFSAPDRPLTCGCCGASDYHLSMGMPGRPKAAVIHDIWIIEQCTRVSSLVSVWPVVLPAMTRLTALTWHLRKVIVDPELNQTSS